MAKKDFPVTPGIRVLRDNKVEFQPFEYEYLEKGGTKQTALELNVDEHAVIKSLVMESEKEAFFVLMHGDLEVSTKELARTLGVKKAEPCKTETALKLTGYMFGGTSPFGSKKALTVYAEETIFDLPEIYINGGKRGFILKMNPQVLIDVLKAQKVKVGIVK